MPQIGAFWSSLVVFTPVIIIAKWVADRQPKDIFDHESWERDLNLFIDKGGAFPDTANYWSVEHRKPKLKTEKVKRQKMVVASLSAVKS